MTRQQFQDEVETWGELYDVASENDYYFDDVYEEDSYNEWVDECIQDKIRHDNWEDVRDFLNDCPNTGYDFYVYDEYDGTMKGRFSEDIDDLKEEFLDWADDRGIWDDEEADDEDEEEEEPEQEPPASTEPVYYIKSADLSSDEMSSTDGQEFDSDIGMDDLFQSSTDLFAEIQKRADEKQKEVDAYMDSITASFEEDGLMF